MQRRALLSLVNIAVATAALLVIFVYPRYAGYAIYVFLGWFVVSFSLVWVARRPSPAAGATLPGATTTPPARPAAALPATPRPAPARGPQVPTEVGFCIYCAADLPADTDRCPTCGHANARLA